MKKDCSSFYSLLSFQQIGIDFFFVLLMFVLVWFGCVPHPGLGNPQGSAGGILGKKPGSVSLYYLMNPGIRILNN